MYPSRASHPCLNCVSLEAKIRSILAPFFTNEAKRPSSLFLLSLHCKAWAVRRLLVAKDCASLSFVGRQVFPGDQRECKAPSPQVESTDSQPRRRGSRTDSASGVLSRIHELADHLQKHVRKAYWRRTAAAQLIPWNHMLSPLQDPENQPLSLNALPKTIYPHRQHCPR